ncbi:hypothetical protein U1Q18_038326 [Sarracenia purpurea var. burkii]
MANTRRLFLLPVRVSLAAITTSSTFYRSRIPYCGKFKPLKNWVKGLEPALKSRMQSSHLTLYMQRCYVNNFCKSGGKFGMGSVFSASVIFGSICLTPSIAYAMDGFDILGDDHRLGLPNASEGEEDPHNFLAFARKLLLPVFLFMTVLMNLDHPIILTTKVILILVGTKPSPFSVYLFIEQLRRQFIHQQPFMYKFKSLYAKKVEVEDYMFLCLARVEIKDQRFTLIGILGSWWVLPWSTCQGPFSVLRNQVLQNYIRN